MISTEQLANKFENELNAVLDYENLSFKLWTTAGERVKSIRQGNDVYTFITGDIKVSANTITANSLVMGVNQITIEFDVPVDPPKTTAKQTAEDLDHIKNGQYWFVQYIMNVLSNYFQKYQAFMMQDENGVEYAVGIVAGVAIPQGIDLQSWRSNSLPVNVYIEANIVQGGIISLDIDVEMDGEVLPFQSFIPDRAGVMTPDVYSGSEVSKVISVSSAFAAEVSIPSNVVYGSSSAAISYLLHGKQNVAHFLKIKWGKAEDAETGLYLVTMTRITGAMQGVSIASFTFRIAELQDNIDLINIPNGFQIGYFVVESSTLESLTFTVSESCLAYIAGKVFEWTAGQSVTVSLEPDSIVYDETSDKYHVYLITNKPVNITGSGIDFEVKSNG